MEAHEVGDTIAETAHEAHDKERFRRSAAVFLGLLGMLLASRPDLSAEIRAPLERHIADYRATAHRYESDPAAGTGKQELLAKAHFYEARRDRAQARDVNFDYSRALYQIAILLGPVSIVGASRPLLYLCGALAAAATLLAANGFLLLLDLPLS